jgi:uncharacterized protein
MARVFPWLKSMTRPAVPRHFRWIAVIFAMGFSLLAYAYFVEPRTLVVNRYEIEIAGWNPAFNGIRIAVLSDIHAGSNGIDREKLRRIVELVNAEDIDLVVMTGDYISRDILSGSQVKMSPEEVAQGLRGIKARFGVFAVLGNHDERFGADLVRRALSSAGYRVLDNDVFVVTEADGQSIRILGLPDHSRIEIWKDFSDRAKRELAETEGTGDVIVLEHSPDVVPVITKELAISNNLKLMIAGHTHGGQVWLPIIGAPIVPSFYGQRFARGHVRERDLDIFISSGIGTSILPLRFMVPPEIAVLTIRRSPQ